MHNRKHNTPGIWTEVPNLLGRVKTKMSRDTWNRNDGLCQGSPQDLKTTPGPYHSFMVEHIKRHVEVCGKPKKNPKSHQQFYHIAQHSLH